VVCHPGTHAKWVLVEEGRIVRFVTAMTGELFAVLRKHSVLKSDAAADDEAAFDEGVAAAGDGGALASRLFSARSRVVAGDARPDTTPSYLSGLLIGAEAAAAPEMLGIAPDAPVALIGEPALTRWYARALKGRRRPISAHNGDEAARAGLFALQQEMAT
jgi:2-dehydro-3-deoxygalactonokinase